jgi:hypothetical protein
MFGINAGKQCVAMSIYAIVYNEISIGNHTGRSAIND